MTQIIPFDGENHYFPDDFTDDDIRAALMSHEPSKSASFTDRLKKTWDQATPGGPLWLAKQAVEGVTGAVDASRAAMSTPQTEEEAFQQNQGRDRGPGFAMEAASVLSPAAPEGTGGLFAAPRAAPAAARAAVPTAASAAPAPTEGLPVL
jgi:hypothetical protein